MGRSGGRGRRAFGVGRFGYGDYEAGNGLVRVVKPADPVLVEAMLDEKRKDKNAIKERAKKSAALKKEDVR